MMRSQSDNASRLQVRSEKPHPRFDVGLGQPAFLGRILVVAANGADAAVKRLLRRLDDRHRNSGVEEIHRYAAAHGAGADDADFLDRQDRRVVRHVGDFPDLALGKKHITLRARLLRWNEVEKRLTFELHAFVERKVDGGLHRPHRGLPRFEAAEFARIVLADFFENLRLAACGLDFVVKVADSPQGHVRVDGLTREGQRPVAQFAFLGERVDDAPFERLLGAERRAGEDNVERILNSGEPRQALRTAGTGNEPELDFGQAELRRGHRDAVVAHQRHLKAAA